jgi:CheY-like chemotaxis protein
MRAKASEHWRYFEPPNGLRARKSSATLYMVRYIVIEAGGKPLATPMTISSAHGPLKAACPDLKGVRILVAEDCWHVASAVKGLLQACGATVGGPVATIAAAQRLISEQTPDVALVDLSLRGGERADVLIDQLHDRGVRVIVITGYTARAPGKAAVILQKPIDEAQLLACLRVVMAPKSMR